MWSWMSALQKGTSHVKTNTRLQDALSASMVESNGVNWFYAVISDGAGTAQYGGQGASIICRTISTKVRAYFAGNSKLPTVQLVDTWLDEARDRIFYCAKLRNLTSRDFAATLIFVISNGSETLSAHVGDGCIVVQDFEKNDWYYMSWPNHGEYASMTYFLTDDVSANVRYTQTNIPIKAIALFSDGLERLALEFSTKSPFLGFFETFIKPLNNSQIVGKNFDLSKSLKNYLDSDAVNSRTDDDKSLIFSVLK